MLHEGALTRSATAMIVILAARADLYWGANEKKNEPLSPQISAALLTIFRSCLGAHLPVLCRYFFVCCAAYSLSPPPPEPGHTGEVLAEVFGSREAEATAIAQLHRECAALA